MRYWLCDCNVLWHKCKLHRKVVVKKAGKGQGKKKQRRQRGPKKGTDKPPPKTCGKRKKYQYKEECYSKDSQNRGEDL